GLSGMSVRQTQVVCPAEQVEASRDTTRLPTLLTHDPKPDTPDKPTVVRRAGRERPARPDAANVQSVWTSGLSGTGLSVTTEGTALSPTGRWPAGGRTSPPSDHGRSGRS